MDDTAGKLKTWGPSAPQTKCSEPLEERALKADRSFRTTYRGHGSALRVPTSCDVGHLGPLLFICEAVTAKVMCRKMQELQAWGP